MTTSLRTVVVDARGRSATPRAARRSSARSRSSRSAGASRADDTGVNLFSVSAPLCATVVGRLPGPRLSDRQSTRAASVAAGFGFVAVQRRFRAGNRLTVAVSKGGLIGKLTSSGSGAHRPPLRTDSCLVPGATTGSTVSKRLTLAIVGAIRRDRSGALLAACGGDDGAAPRSRGGSSRQVDAEPTPARPRPARGEAHRSSRRLRRSRTARAAERPQAPAGGQAARAAAPPVGHPPAPQ